MSLIALVAIWLAFVIPLIVAAVGRTRMSSKIGALAGLAVVGSIGCLAIMMAMGDIAAHSDTSSWPRPVTIGGGFLIAYLLVVFAAFRRKLR